MNHISSNIMFSFFMQHLHFYCIVIIKIIVLNLDSKNILISYFRIQLIVLFLIFKPLSMSNYFIMYKELLKLNQPKQVVRAYALEAVTVFYFSDFLFSKVFVEYSVRKGNSFYSFMSVFFAYCKINSDPPIFA